jgi:hypothetical protein
MGFAGARFCESCETFANRHGLDKSKHPLVGKICFGPQRRRAGRTPRRWRVGGDGADGDAFWLAMVA